MEFNVKLQELQSKVLRKKKVSAMLKELESQKDAIIERENTLKKEKLKEERDVETLEGRSLSAFFYAVIGKKEEKLSEEQAQAYAAKVKYETIVSQRNAIENEIMSLRNEMNTLIDCENEYKDLMEQKTSWLKEQDSTSKVEIDKLEEKVVLLENQIKEIREAHAAGENVLSVIDNIEEELSSAEGWGTWDLMGGGLLSDMAKHSHLDSAQEEIQHLQEQLRRFKTELADITISADIQVQIEGFLRFADYFFDGLFADWAVLDSIHSSQDEISQTKEKVNLVMNQLNRMEQTLEQEVSDTKVELDELIRKA